MYWQQSCRKYHGTIQSFPIEAPDTESVLRIGSTESAWGTLNEVITETHREDRDGDPWLLPTCWAASHAVPAHLWLLFPLLKMLFPLTFSWLSGDSYFRSHIIAQRISFLPVQSGPLPPTLVLFYLFPPVLHSSNHSLKRSALLAYFLSISFTYTKDPRA